MGRVDIRFEFKTSVRALERRGGTRIRFLSEMMKVCYFDLGWRAIRFGLKVHSSTNLRCLRSSGSAMI